MAGEEAVHAANCGQGKALAGDDVSCASYANCGSTATMLATQFEAQLRSSLHGGCRFERFAHVRIVQENRVKQPEFVLNNGTTVRTHEQLDTTDGMLIREHHLRERRSNTDGKITGVVAGHGGDVYWVRHHGANFDAAYRFTEFELVDGRDPALSQVISGIQDAELRRVLKMREAGLPPLYPIPGETVGEGDALRWRGPEDELLDGFSVALRGTTAPQVAFRGKGPGFRPGDLGECPACRGGFCPGHGTM